MEMQQLKEKLSKVKKDISYEAPSDIVEQLSESLCIGDSKKRNPSSFSQGANLKLISQALNEIKKMLQKD
ncbi:hypothetical protein [Sphingobacterium sp. LRF_L2]|uniref:hypothetical protein n=1 Tax=Sphingobacterium sp. LRF_L2 TaxID=3369421 RepID=UPI003F60B855